MTKKEFITERTRIISEMLDDPNEVGIHNTGKCFARLDQLYDKLVQPVQKSPSDTAVKEPIDILQEYDKDSGFEFRQPQLNWAIAACRDFHEQFTSIRPGQALSNEAIELMWDDASEIIGETIDSLEYFAGRNVAVKESFVKAICGYRTLNVKTKEIEPSATWVRADVFDFGSIIIDRYYLLAACREGEYVAAPFLCTGQWIYDMYAEDGIPDDYLIMFIPVRDGK